ncbi:MAG TPA: PAS domain-containing sensor histidine kinase [Ignavibacteriaceae bacterium]|nr:PAS domain-containing sensor histidine kinase [Ignavibacteriaceae bacterium]
MNSQNEINTNHSLINNLAGIIEQFPSPVFLLNDAGILIEMNHLGAALIGKEKKKIISKKFSELIEKNHRDDFNKALENACACLKPQVIETKVRGADKNYFPSLVLVKCSESPHPEAKFFFLSVIDLTNQKMKEEVIIESQARFENIANTAPVMIWIADVEGLFSFVNRVWTEYIGKKQGYNLGMNWLNEVHHEDMEDLVNKYRDAFANRKSFTHEFRLKGKDSRFQWMMIRGVPRLSPENIFLGFIGSCTNINAQKEFEEKIKKVNDELVEINAVKDKFFSIISHDLRSPLGGLMGILEILEEGYDSMEEQEIREIITEAASSSKLAYNLMENLLQWSRIQTGKIPYEPEKFEILSVLQKLELLFAQNLKNKEIKFIIDVQPGTFAYADVKMTETILRNLISNAIKFTNINGTITAAAELKDKFIILKVGDTGVGIDEKDLSKLFRMDVSFTTKGTAKETGTGLGLILCKELVERQGGEIWVESRKNIGTAFYFKLPSENFR